MTKIGEKYGTFSERKATLQQKSVREKEIVDKHGIKTIEYYDAGGKMIGSSTAPNQKTKEAEAFFNSQSNYSPAPNAKLLDATTGIISDGNVNYFTDKSGKVKSIIDNSTGTLYKDENNNGTIDEQDKQEEKNWFC